MTRIAVFPGSFDPMTNAHLDVARRASGLFDRLVIGVLSDAGKHHVRVLRRKPGTGGRAAGIHDRREGLLDGLGLEDRLFHVEIFPMKCKTSLAP